MLCFRFYCSSCCCCCCRGIWISRLSAAMMAIIMPLSQRNAGRASNGVWLAGFLPPSSFPLLPLFFSPLVAQVCKRKNKMKEKKERDLVGEMRKIPYLPTYLSYLPTSLLPTYLLTLATYLPTYLLTLAT